MSPGRNRQRDQRRDHHRGRTPKHQIAKRTLVGALLAVLAGAVTLTLDGFVSAGTLPRMLRFPPDNARTLLAALVGAVVTLSAFAFWMRAVMAQLASSAVSPRIVAVHLYDRFQQTLVGFMAGALVYVALVLQHVGSSDQSPPFPDVPHVSVAGAILVTLGALVTMIYSMYRSAESLQVGNLVARMGQDLAERASELVRQQADAHSAAHPEVDLPSTVHASSTGFVQHIDEEAVLDALPEDAVARLEVDVGTFVVAHHTALVHLSVRDGAVEECSERIRSAFTVGPSRTLTHDVGYGIQQLVDVGEQTLGVGSSAASTIYDVLLWLGAVLRTLLDVEPPPRVVAGPAGKRLVRGAQMRPADFVGEAFNRLRQGGAHFPGVAQRLVEILSGLRDDFEGRGRDEVVEALERQLRLTLAAVEGSEAPADEIAVLHEMAFGKRASAGARARFRAVRRG